MGATASMGITESALSGLLKIGIFKGTSTEAAVIGDSLNSNFISWTLAGAKVKHVYPFLLPSMCGFTNLGH